MNSIHSPTISIWTTPKATSCASNSKVDRRNLSRPSHNQDYRNSFNLETKEKELGCAPHKKFLTTQPNLLQNRRVIPTMEPGKLTYINWLSKSRWTRCRRKALRWKSANFRWIRNLCSRWSLLCRRISQPSRKTFSSRCSMIRHRKFLLIEESWNWNTKINRCRELSGLSMEKSQNWKAKMNRCREKLVLSMVDSRNWKEKMNGCREKSVFSMVDSRNCKA